MFLNPTSWLLSFSPAGNPPASRHTFHPLLTPVLPSLAPSCLFSPT